MPTTSSARILLLADPAVQEQLATLVEAAGGRVVARGTDVGTAAQVLSGADADGVLAGEGIDLPTLLAAVGGMEGGVAVVALVGPGEGAQEAALEAGAAEALATDEVTAEALRRAFRSAGRYARLHARLGHERGTLYGNLPGMVYRCRNDPRWTMEFASDRSLGLTGYTPRELVSGAVAYADLIHPDDRARVWDEVQRAVQAGEAYRCTYRLRAADGQEKWVCDEGVVIAAADATGEALLEGFVSDVSGHVRAAAALAESERWHRTLLENAEDAIVVVDRGGAVRFATPSLSRILGADPGTLARTPLREFVPAPELERAMAFRAELLAHPGEVRTARIPFRTAQGPTRLLELVARSLLHDPAMRGIVVNARDVTDRETADRRLAESEQRFKSLFEYNPDAVFSLDPQGRVTAWNAAAALLTGYPAEDVIGREYGTLVHPADLERTSEAFRLTLAGEPQTYEIRLAPRSGAFTQVLIVKLPMVVNGAIEGVFGIAHDVTENRITERELRLRDRAIAAVDEGIIITDPHQPDNPVISVNPAFQRLTGYAPDQVLGRNCRFLQGPGSDPVVVAEMTAAMEAGLSTTVEILNYRRDGRPFWNRIALAPVRDNRGDVTHYIGVLNDVTARREAEEALRSREARFRSMLEHAHDIVAVMDGDGSVSFASPAVERVLGYSRESLERMDLQPLVHPDDLPAVQAALDDAVMHPGKPTWLELRLKHRDGGWRIMETVGTSLLHMPSVMGLVVNARDVTERREAEAALAESRMQFLQAQKMEAVGRLAGGVAHDFNNLLTAIRGNADLLLLTLHEGDPARDDVMEIRRASDRAAELTRQLLAFSRRQVLQPRVLNLNAVVRDVERMLRRLMTGQVQLEARLHPALGETVADAGQLEQVLVNLAVNARDAMPQGGLVVIETDNVEVDGEMARRLPYVVPGAYVLLRVRDTGHGMDADTRQRVFEPFFTTKGPGKGTGLGLSTVYGIVKQSGGYIWVDSEPGQGTVFSIYLPRARDGARAEADAAPEAEAPPSTGGETVLVVDDEVAVRNLAGRVLSRAGYRVVEVDDGFEALRFAGEDAPLHVLVTDLSMPRMGGRELARRLLELRPNVGVLFFSGTAAEMEETPGAAFLEKPFTAEALLRAVRDVLDAPPPAQAPPPG